MKRSQQRVVAVAGGFDPIHIGHVRLLQEAKKLGDKLVVIINNDNWLLAKKGHSFMSEDDRKEMIEAFMCVDRAIISFHEECPQDMSVKSELRALMPAIFATDKHYYNRNIAEYELCSELGITTEFIAGDKKHPANTVKAEIISS